MNPSLHFIANDLQNPIHKITRLNHRQRNHFYMSLSTYLSADLSAYFHSSLTAFDDNATGRTTLAHLIDGRVE
jgi:hypothetical protein